MALCQTTLCKCEIPAEAKAVAALCGPTLCEVVEEETPLAPCEDVEEEAPLAPCEDAEEEALVGEEEVLEGPVRKIGTHPSPEVRQFIVGLYGPRLECWR